MERLTTRDFIGARSFSMINRRRTKPNRGIIFLEESEKRNL
jgi:hypothetical protein